MKVLHITEYCHASSVGGTERYILDLIQGLNACGIENSIGWLCPEGSCQSFNSVGTRIFSLPSPQMRVDAPVSDLRPAAQQLFTSERPDVVHFHTFGLSEGYVAQLATERGVPYAFTYHSPAWTCRRGTLLHYGKEPCDGELRAWRCSACQAEERMNLGRAGGHFATALSLMVGWGGLLFGRTSVRRRSAFFYDSLRYHNALRRFLADCDLAISCCDWSGPLLERNGVKRKCLVHCPQGVPNAASAALRPMMEAVQSDGAKQFVVGYVGRVTEVKGVHILMQGFSRTTDQQARLRIVGWEPENEKRPYQRLLKEHAQADSRIQLVPKRSLIEAFHEYQRLSLLAIPSTWMETGPLTLLEALAQGIPVYGSNRVGQLGLLRKHGRIVEPNSPSGWHSALTDAITEFREGRWAAHRKPTCADPKVRTMTDVAAEMAGYYQNLVKRTNPEDGNPHVERQGSERSRGSPQPSHLAAEFRT